MEIPEDNHITFLIMAIITVVSLIALKNKKVFEKLLLHPATVIHYREYHRVITSALVHNNLLHLGVNLLVLYVFCSGIEESTIITGRLTLISVVAASLLVGSILSLLMHGRNISYSSVGASAIAVGCMCAYLILHPNQNHVSVPLLDNVPNIFAAVGYFGLMLFYSRKDKSGRIDYTLHIGGGMGGSITAVLMHPNVILGI